MASPADERELLHPARFAAMQSVDRRIVGPYAPPGEDNFAGSFKCPLIVPATQAAKGWRKNVCARTFRVEAYSAVCFPPSRWKCCEIFAKLTVAFVIHTVATMTANRAENAAALNAAALHLHLKQAPGTQEVSGG
jgi:hypothetical protein